jgi:hypothetical protein
MKSLRGFPAIWRLVAVGACVLTTACTTVPQQEFKAYTDAFAEVKTASEEFLADYAVLKAQRDEKKAAAAKAKASAANGVFPFSASLPTLNAAVGALDEVAERRNALQVVVGYNDLLTALAEGKKPDALKPRVESLVGNIQKVGGLFGKTIPVPYVGEVAKLVSTVLSKLEEAANRQQFIEALRTGEPLIQGILIAMSEDGRDWYAIGYEMNRKRAADLQDEVGTKVRGMRSLARGYATPAAGRPAVLDALEKKVRAALDQAALTKNLESLPTTGSA